MKTRSRLGLASVLLLLTGGAFWSCDDEDDPVVTPAGTQLPPDAGSDAAPDADASAINVQIAGLSASVSVVTDEHGILHLSCQTDEDCIAALGYVHASNRFFTMDFVRHLMRGSLAGLVKAGDILLESDYYYRHFLTTTAGEPLEEVVVAGLSSESQALLHRYSAGVNAWLEDVRQDRNGAELSVEYEFDLMAVDVLEDWEPEDTIAVAFYMMTDLGNTVDSELQYAEMVTAYTPELASDLLMVRPPFGDYTVTAAGGAFDGPSSQGLSAQNMSELAARLAPARELITRARQGLSRAVRPFHEGSEVARGSNNWVVGPGRTSSGNALLANDPHLGMSNPAVFLPAEIDSKSGGSGTLHAAGGTIPGLPAVLNGHSEDLAWGVTTVFYDLNEVYIETLNPEGTAVWFEGDWVPIFTKDFQFANAAGDPATKSFKWVPHHGPIIAEDLDNDLAISVRWIPHEGVLTDVDAFLNLARATSVAEVPAALADLTATDQNFVVVDRQGSIGWFPLGAVPNRPWASLAVPSWAPVPGDGSAEWSGTIAPAELPQLVDPPNGFIATANQDITGATDDGDPTNDGHPVLQAWSSAIGARMNRIVGQLDAGGNAHTVDTLLALQADTYSVLAEALVPPLLLELDGAVLDGPAQSVHDALQQWQYTCPTGLTSSDYQSDKDPDVDVARESIGCMAFHTLLYVLRDKALADEEAAAGVDVFFRSWINVLITDLTDPGQLQTAGSFWDDVSTDPAVETRTEMVVAAVTEAGSLLDAWKPEPDDWRWGRKHLITFSSIFNSFGIGTYNYGPFANDGGLCTVDVAAPHGNGLNMAQSHGPTVRLVVEATGAGMSMKFQHAGGTNLDRESPFYNQLVDEYLRNEPIDFPFGPDAVPEPAEQFIIEPAD